MSTTGNSLLVVKVGGSIQDDPAQIASVMADAARLATAGLRPIIVHGGGKAISAAMKEAGFTPRFVAGQRYTDHPTLAIAERILAQVVNRQLCEDLARAGARPLPLHSMGRCVLQARRSDQPARPGEPAVDLGLVGVVTSVDSAQLLAAARQGAVPVIAPIATDASPRPGDPGKLNVNADLAAGVVAASLRPAGFILVSDTPGIRVNQTDYAPALSRAEVSGLIESGVIDGGMLPKVQACLDALAAGVPAVHIVDGRRPGALHDAATGGQVVGTTLTP